MGILITIIITILLFIFWCTQFLRLMSMKSEDFLSREDKSIWAATVVLLNIFGAFLFWIHFRPKHEILPQLDTDLYEEAKRRFSEHQKEIDLALKMPSYKRYDLEKWYRKKNTPDLIIQYRKGPSDTEPACFGILLAILTSRNIKTTDS
jgi:hypothetical protein